MDLLLDDACVALSLLLQHGVRPRDLAHSMGRLEEKAPASIIGALIDLVVDQTDASLPNRTDRPAAQLPDQA